jgi:hypothetical protein
MIARRDVKAPIAASQRCPHEFRLVNVTLDSLELSTAQTPQVTFRTQQQLYLVSTCNQFMNQVRANETGSTRNETFHTDRDGSPAPFKQIEASGIARGMRLQITGSGGAGKLNFEIHKI